MLLVECAKSVFNDNTNHNSVPCPEPLTQGNGFSLESMNLRENPSSSATSSDGLVLRPSILSDEVAGVFTMHKITKNTVLGPYLGEVVHADSAVSRKECLSWQIYSPENFLLYKIDASNAGKSNWMRYVNLATLDHFPNLSAFQLNGKVFYRAIRDILPDEELLVWRAVKYNQDCDKKEIKKVHKFTEIKQPMEVKERKMKGGRARKGKKTDKFQCDSCQYSTSIWNLYSNHLLNHIQNKTYTCDLCDASFAFKHVLELHRTSHPDTTDPLPSTTSCPFKCMWCAEAFERKDALAAHKCSLQCDICGAHMASIISLNNHKRVHKNYWPDPVCDICGFESTSMRALWKHKNRKHASDFLKCNQCDVVCENKTALRNHLQQHEHHWPGHICEICGFESTTAKALWKHKNRKHASKVLKCDHCDVICENKTALRTHLQQHDDDQAFKCAYCDSLFLLAVDLEAHTKKHTEPRIFKCSECEASFKTQRALKDHFPLHVDDLRLQSQAVESLIPYDGSLKCNVCDRLMPSRLALNDHKRTHNRHGYLSRICDICGFEATTPRALWRHKYRGHASEALKCQECFLLCKNKSALMLHLEEHGPKTL